MLNEKNQDLDPNEGTEEKKYSFLQETIKTRPASRKQIGKQFLRIAIYGVILGMFACIGFYALKPWAQSRFSGNLKPVTIPEDEEPSEDTASEEQPDETAPVMNAESYGEMMDSMNEIAGEAAKGIASVEPVLKEEDWNSEMTGMHKSVTGLITADNGQELLILADASACDDATEWNIRFQDGKSYAASLKKRDGNSHLAVFSVPRKNLTDSTWASIKVSALGNSNLVTRGDTVIAFGNMFGYADGMTYGMVSSTDYKMTFFDGECNIIATDIPLQNKGTGVLFNMKGEAVGMISSSVWSDNENTTVNAYAVSDLKTVIERLANGESVPYAGVYGTTVTAELAEQKGMPQGVYVVDVDPDSPAMAAGIQCGDILCEVDGEKISSISVFQRVMLEKNVGKEIKIIGQRLGVDGYVDIEYSVTVGAKE